MCTCRLEREWVGLKEGATTSREGDWGPGVAEREGIWEREGEAMAIRGKLGRGCFTVLGHIPYMLLPDNIPTPP